MIEKKVIFNYKQALEKAQKFCVYQERCQKEARSKLYEWNMNPEEVESIISDLITNNFINEERYAKTYARGKFKIKHWGRNKIKSELRKKNISEKCINIGLIEIDESEYFTTLEELLKKKSLLLQKANAYLFKNKLAEFVISKGYESNIVWEVIENL